MSSLPSLLPIEPFTRPVHGAVVLHVDHHVVRDEPLLAETMEARLQGLHPVRCVHAERDVEAAGLRGGNEDLEARHRCPLG